MSLRAEKLGPVFSMPLPFGGATSAQTLTTRMLRELAAVRVTWQHGPRFDIIEAAMIQ